jgi:DNA ligase (NAD+)
MPSPSQRAQQSADLRARLTTMSVAELETQVRHHNARYWDEHDPEIDDPTFDTLLEVLRDKAPSSPALQDLGASPQKAGKAGFGDIVHSRPMLSLEKCYDDDTLMKWSATFKGPIMVTPKIDGLACSLRYDDRGRLQIAGTRGDGKTGDAITENVRGIAEVPRQLKLPAGAAGGVEVRGEVYMRVSRFNATYKGEKSNPRNLAAGALKTKDPAESAAYGLSFFAYDLTDAGCATEVDKRRVLEEMGFKLPPGELVTDRDALPEAFRRFVDVCRGMDTETDGVVMKADSVFEQDRLGATAHHPRGALAYKFQGESAHTVVKAIEWGVARTGVVTPVAVVDPVFVSGVTVTRVSLHNAGYARKLGVGIGARVDIVRRGGVIPHVEAVLSPPTEPLTVPASWPGREGNIEVVSLGDFAVLKEPERCVDVVVSRVAHFAKVTDITGFGDKRLTQLVDKGLVTSPAHLYRLDKATLAGLDRMGDVSAQNLLDQMAARRQLTLPVFLTALGIDDLGPTVAEAIVAHFHTLEALRAAKPEAFLEVHGIGSTTAASVVDGLRQLAPVIDALLGEVTIVEPSRVEDTGSGLFGKSVVFTGTMALMDRKTAQKKVQGLGGKTPSSVTADLDYLVIGDEGSALLGGGEKSTKHKAAEKLQQKGAAVQIISETAFVAMLGDRVAFGDKVALGDKG